MSENQLQALLQAIRTLQDLGKVAYFNKGVYNSETNYERNDVVSYNGSSYVSSGNNNQGNLPTNATYWSVVALKGDKGDTGKPFVIEKTYESIEDMVADYDNMQVNDYVMIQGNIEEEENATLWTKTETEVSPYKWVYLADFSGASGITGQTPNIQIGTVTEGNEPSVTRRAGSSNENPILDFVLKTGATGATGATGNGISSVSKTSTSGLTDTYTIAYTNGNNTTFDVNNGKGISNIAKTSTSGLVDTYTITYNDNSTSTFEITNGEDGEVTQAQLDETNSEVDLLKKIYNAFPTVSNQAEKITLDGTAEVQFKNFELKGNTSQNTTTGKNLFATTGNLASSINESTQMTKTGAGTECTLTKNSIGSASPRIEFDSNFFEVNTTYYISFEVKGDWTKLEFGTWIGDQQAVIDTKTPTSTYQKVTCQFTYPSTKTSNDKVYFKNNDRNVSVGQTLTINNFMISKTNDYDYEPFTGNQPSPNPDYPQDIQVVTGDNSIKVEGKNLFNLKDTYYKRLDTGSVTTNDNDIKVENVNTVAHQLIWWNIPVKIGEQITISYNSLTESISDNNNGVFYTFNDEPYTSFVSFDSFSKVDKTNKYSTTTATKKYLVIGLRNVPSCTNICSKLQVELGSAVSEYQEFQGNQIYSVNLPVKNLFDNSLMTEWSNVIRYISVNVDKNTDYTLSTSNPGQGATNAKVFLSTSNSSVTSNENGAWNDRPRTINSGNNNIIYVAYRGAIEDKTQYWYQLEKGSKANSYTAYGTTPIELCKIGDYQDIIKKSTGKNLWGGFTFSKTINGISCVTNEDGSITCSGTSTANAFSMVTAEATNYLKTLDAGTYTISGGTSNIYIQLCDSNGNLIAETTTSILTKTFTINQTTSVYLRAYIVSGKTVDETIYSMLEKGSAPSEYEPYGKVWCKYSAIGKVVLDGSEDWTLNQYNYFQTIVNNSTSDSNKRNGYSSHFKYEYDTGNNKIFFMVDGFIRIKCTSITNTDDFKTWLSTHNTEVYYILATPTYTKITDATLIEQLNNLEKAYSYDKQTNISQINADKPFIINAEAIMSLKNILN